MSKIHVEIEIENGSSIRFDADLNKVLGRRAEPHEIIGGLERIILPGITRALGLRTEEDEAAINAEAVERANAMLETMLAAQAEEAAREEVRDMDPTEDEAADQILREEPLTQAQLTGYSTEYLEAIPDSTRTPVVTAELERRRVAHIEAEILEDAAAKVRAERPDLDVEVIPSAEGEVRVKAKTPPPANRATRRRK